MATHKEPVKLEVVSKKARIKRLQNGLFHVGFGDKNYLVNRYGSKWHCPCSNHTSREVDCEHIKAAKAWLASNKGTTIATTYPQNWHAYNQAQTREKSLFLPLLHDLTRFRQEKNFGRPRLNLGEMAFCACLKVYTRFSLRRTMSDIQEALEKRFISKKPHYNSISNYFNHAQLAPFLKRLVEISALPLKNVETSFSIDATGFSTSRFARWFDHKWGKEKAKRVWLKAHIMVGNKTNIVTSVEITTGNRHDSPVLPHLLNQTRGFDIQEVSADLGYSSSTNLQAIFDASAFPYIPFKKNATGRSGKSPIWNRMFHYFQMNRDEFMDRYHKRSNVETAFHMIKAKFGDNLRNKKFVSEKNELLCKILCHNICVLIQEMHELGIQPTFWAEPLFAQKIIKT